MTTPYLYTCQGLMAYPSLYIKEDRRRAIFECLTGWDLKNRFDIFAASPSRIVAEQPILKVKESCSLAARIFCGYNREFQMSITTNAGDEILYLDAPFRWDCCCGMFFPRTLKVWSGATAYSPRTFLGSVTTAYAPCTPHIQVFDHNGDEVYHLTGDYCFCFEYDLEILDAAGKEVGHIIKTWNGCCPEAFIDTKTYHLIFPEHSNPQQRGLLLGAVFLAQVLIFEKFEMKKNRH